MLPMILHTSLTFSENSLGKRNGRIIYQCGQYMIEHGNTWLKLFTLSIPHIFPTWYQCHHLLEICLLWKFYSEILRVLPLTFVYVLFLFLNKTPKWRIQSWSQLLYIALLIRKDKYYTWKLMQTQLLETLYRWRRLVLDFYGMLSLPMLKNNSTK